MTFDRQRAIDEAIRDQDRRMLEHDRHAEPCEPLPGTHCGECGMRLEDDGGCENCEWMALVDADEEDDE